MHNETCTVNSGIQDISVSSVRDHHNDCCCWQECRKLPIGSLYQPALFIHWKDILPFREVSGFSVLTLFSALTPRITFPILQMDQTPAWSRDKKKNDRQESLVNVSLLLSHWSCSLHTDHWAISQLTHLLQNGEAEARCYRTYFSIAAPSFVVLTNRLWIQILPHHIPKVQMILHNAYYD